MANNLGVTTGSDATLKTTDNASVHTPHHNIEIAGNTPALGAGNVGSTVPRITLATDDSVGAAIVSAVTDVETAVGAATIDTGTAGAPGTDVITVQGIASMTPIEVSVNAGTNNIGDVDVVNLPGQKYETVAASQTAQALGATGASGDLLNGVLVIPATTSPGNVQIKDGSDAAITVFTGGTSSVTTLIPFFIPLGIKSTDGAWQIATGANVSAIGVGDFT